MRTGGCTVQQALTAEAAAVVKQAVTLARRRGHAQVTPLHVANTMLASSSGLLRTACLQSHSHPLQCKALELCFNVALNRLPASTSSPMLGPHSQQFPSISNALVAAFKRAQAHQRRGSIESQQQPLLAVKIELEQLIVSILDDPSVSRVMREAGFSSTQVKSNIEQAVSLEMCSKNAPSTTSKSKESNALALPQSHPSSPVGKRISKSTLLLDPIRNEDVLTVIEFLVSSQRRSFVIVGECLGSIESVVKGVMDKVHNGDVPEVLRELKFITLAASSFRHLSVMEVEQKFEELRSLVGSYMRAGVVLNLGDLKCAIENSSTSSAMQPRGYFCPMERMIMKLGELASGIGEKNNGRFWLIGLATFQTYMKLKSGHPSQNTVLGLHPLTIPAGCLRLSLIIDSDQQSESQSNRPEKGSTWIALEVGEEKNLKCCADCSAQFEIEARSLQSRRCNSDSTTSSLPAWLKECKNEKNTDNSNDKDCILITDLRRKWNSICSSNHQHLYSSDKTHSFASVSPAPSTSGLSYDFKYPNRQQIHHDWPIVEPKESWRDHHIWIGSEAPEKGNVEPGLRLYVPEHRDHPEHPFSSDPNSTPNSTSSSDVMDLEYVHRFKELNAENLKTLCNALERKVPWQKDIIPDIASTILQCRSGMVRRKGNGRGSEPKEETWMLFQGLDTDAKEKIAKELASLVFGSQTNHVSIALTSFSSTRADSSEDFRNKRTRDEQTCSYIERFAEAVSSNPHRVFLVEDVDQADYCSQMGFKRAIGGKITNSKGEDVGLSDSIIILSCESFSSRSRACTPPTKQKITDGPDGEVKSDNCAAMEDSSSPCPHLDLNISMDDDKEEDQSIDDIGLLDSVDRRIVFSIQEL